MFSSSLSSSRGGGDGRFRTSRGGRGGERVSGKSAGVVRWVWVEVGGRGGGRSSSAGDKEEADWVGLGVEEVCFGGGLSPDKGDGEVKGEREFILNGDVLPVWTG